jgi:uncharacterized membrane protein YdbT with pleckstrin-like domain
VCLDARRHTMVLVRPLARAVLLAALGIVLLALPWPLSAAGAVVLVVAAVTAFVAVLRWDRTRIVVTTEKVFLVRGVTRRRASAVMLSSLQLVELEQTLPGRVLGYGTLQAGPLEVDYVPDPCRVRDLVERLAA